MPGATTASEVFFEAAIDWKLVMMPQTVPNRPMNGRGRADRREHQQAPLQPLDLARDGHVHHLVDAHLKAADRRGWCPRTSASTRASRRRTARPSNASAAPTGVR